MRLRSREASNPPRGSLTSEEILPAEGFAQPSPPCSTGPDANVENAAPICLPALAPQLLPGALPTAARGAATATQVNSRVSTVDEGGATHGDAHAAEASHRDNSGVCFNCEHIFMGPRRPQKDRAAPSSEISKSGTASSPPSLKTQDRGWVILNDNRSRPEI